jgi:hypothetical protein
MGAERERVDLDRLEAWAGHEDHSELTCQDSDRMLLRLAAALRELRERIAEYENAITWGTSCLTCARVLDASIADHQRAEKAEEKLRLVHEVVAACQSLGAIMAGADSAEWGEIMRALEAYDRHDPPAGGDQAEDGGS